MVEHLARGLGNNHSVGGVCVQAVLYLECIKPGRPNQMIRTLISASVLAVGLVAAFAQSDQIISSAKTFPTLCPDNAKPGAKTSAPPEDKYSASSKVWENKADFEAKNANLIQVVTSVRGNVKDLDSLKVAADQVGKACDACHETYRLRAN